MVPWDFNQNKKCDVPPYGPPYIQQHNKPSKQNKTLSDEVNSV